MSEFEKKKIIFLDRDGTICTDEGVYHKKILDYEENIKQVKLIDGCYEALKNLKDNGYLLIVISNQAGVAKGIFKEGDIHKFNKKINNLLDDMIDGFYYCIHHSKYNLGENVNKEKVVNELLLECGCRKPKTGMFLKCKDDLKKGVIQYIDEDLINSDCIYKKDRNIYKKPIQKTIIDIKNSYMIGDKKIDLVCGKNFDLKTIFVKTGEGTQEIEKNLIKDVDYDFIASDILEASNYILNKNK